MCRRLTFEDTPVTKNMLLAVLAGSLVSMSPCFAQDAKPGAGSGQAVAKKQVNSADDLPTHTYKLDSKPSEMLDGDNASFNKFLAEVKSNVESDLAEYDISDKTTLRDMHAMLAVIALMEGKDDVVRAQYEKVRANETKESSRLMVGQVGSAMMDAKKAAKIDDPTDQTFAAEFEKSLGERLGQLPWDKVSEEVKRMKAASMMLTKDLLVGQVVAGIDPVWEQQKGELSGEIATALVRIRFIIKKQLPLNPIVTRVAESVIDKHAVAMVDTWTPTVATLTGKEGGKTVTICVWDSGVDMSIFSGHVWTNTHEQFDGKDDDGNGFVDDVHGIAFDLNEEHAIDLLHPITEMHNEVALVRGHTKGLMDLQANIDSTESKALVKYLQGLKASETGTFQEDLGLYGNHSHGTHVTGISLAGNPYASVLPVRLSFDYHNIPTVTPTEELAHRMAKNYMDAVNYMKAAGVRVVNMSWGGSKQDVETQLEQKGVGKDSDERDAIARKIFDIQKVGLEAAIKSAPEVLFVAAAGNSDNDNAFAEFIPSGFNLPNMITIGAIDSSGKPTGFTTFGGNVTLYANGFEVESFVPGGERMKFSGTSMAAPQVTNLAGKMFAMKPTLTVVEAISLIKRGADQMAGKEGRFIINQKKTMELLEKGGGN